MSFFAPREILCVFSFDFFQDFFFIFDFSVVCLKMISLDVGRCRGILPCSVFSELPGSVSWYLMFIWGKFSVIVVLHVSSLFLLLL